MSAGYLEPGTLVTFGNKSVKCERRILVGRIPSLSYLFELEVELQDPLIEVSYRLGLRSGASGRKVDPGPVYPLLMRAESLPCQSYSETRVLASRCSPIPCPRCETQCLRKVDQL